MATTDTSFKVKNNLVVLGTLSSSFAANVAVTGTITAISFSGDGANLTNLNASALATGTIATARMGSGTANSTTVLYGNNVWATLPPSAGTTNLSYSANSITITILSDTGGDAVVPTANSTIAGVITAANQTKLDGIQSGAQVNVPTDLSMSANSISVAINSSTGTDIVVAAANSTVAGVMSASDYGRLANTSGTNTGDQTTITGNAGSATVLQTARTINGTSFNGSANITTASWGTSRTLTIGSTGKPVDGSAAVSWSLSEIGAQARILGGATTYGYWAEGIAAYGNVNANNVGALVIKTSILDAPVVNRMMVIRVRGYNYSSTTGPWELTLGGYVYNPNTTPQFINHAYILHGSSPFSGVQRAVTPDGYVCFILGSDSTSWNYPKVLVDAMDSFTGSSEAELTGWSITVEPDTTAYTGKTSATRRQFAPVTIGGVLFDASSNINLPGVNTPGTQNTSGSAAKLTTARTIALSGIVTGTATSFDGSANITIPVTAVDLGNANNTGTIADARLSANVVMVSGTQTISGAKTFTAQPVIDQGNIINQQSLLINNTGAGTTGIMITRASSQGWIEIGGQTGSAFQISSTNRTIEYVALGGAYDSAPMSHKFTHDTPAKSVVVVRGAGSQSANTFEVQSSSNTPLFSVAANGSSYTSSIEIGYRRIPLTVKNSNYTIAATDSGNGLQHSDTTAYNYTVDGGIMSNGDVVTILNDTGTGVLTIVQGTGMTLYFAGVGNTGNRTVSVRGLATLYFSNSTVCYVSGAGVN